MTHFEKYGTYNPDQMLSVDPFDLVQHCVLNRLNHLSSLLFEQDPTIQQRFLKVLNMRFDSLIQQEIVNLDGLEEIVNNYDFLIKHPEIIENSMNYCFQVMDLAEHNWANSRLDILEGQQLRGILHTIYQFLLVLTGVLGRENAVELFKLHIDQFFHKSSRIPKVDDIEAMRNKYINDAQEGGEIRIVSELKDGKFVNRKDTCLWADIMREISEDSELSYLVACYADFKYTTEMNENFILTRTCTIIEGGPYCDEVIHDTSINDSIKHPSREYFDYIWPKNKYKCNGFIKSNSI
ncbi:MAG: L-2-amino-thiazoline-4-carboxylic acid hydrolase [Candidatus Kariarchaeaceae archaeon]|jgi:hypothetical protein